ncbi:hypothetical protein [Deinococcus roseus]|uniref:DUF2188 domain-containing protein n=1 Tax=Deinococcus roseus TaxID=392414 RepID=A0ABQ2DGN0_9DEIO|nr:hypothetical protein [Deinococcus roseus]GGJ56574.1 hypothetical protein GCM10008938_48400 [Deinococcus roseus]
MKLSEHDSKAAAKSAADKARKTHNSVIYFQRPSTGKWEVRAGKKK